MCVNVSWGRPVGLCLRMLSASVRQGEENKKGFSTSLTYVSDPQANMLEVTVPFSADRPLLIQQHAVASRALRSERFDAAPPNL